MKGMSCLQIHFARVNGRVRQKCQAVKFLGDKPTPGLQRFNNPSHCHFRIRKMHQDQPNVSEVKLAVRKVLTPNIMAAYFQVRIGEGFEEPRVNICSEHTSRNPDAHTARRRSILRLDQLPDKTTPSQRLAFRCGGSCLRRRAQTIRDTLPAHFRRRYRTHTCLPRFFQPLLLRLFSLRSSSLFPRTPKPQTIECGASGHLFVLPNKGPTDSCGSRLCLSKPPGPSGRSRLGPSRNNRSTRKVV